MIPSAHPIQLPPALDRSTRICDALRDVVFDRGPKAVTSAWELAARDRVDLAEIKPAIEDVAKLGKPVRLVIDGAWFRLDGEPV
jgi:hypothetical protein